MQAAELSGHTLERDAPPAWSRPTPARAVTSLAWLAAPFAEAPGGKERVVALPAPDSVTFGPMAGNDRELFERDLRAYAGKRVLELMGAAVEFGSDRLTVRFPPAT